MMLRKFYVTLLGLGVGAFAAQILQGCSTAPVTSPVSQREPSGNSASKGATALPTVAENDEGFNENGPLVTNRMARREIADFQWPVDQAKLTRGFLPFKRKPHWGVDLAAPKGTPILAAHDGTIIYTGRDFRGYGKMVMIEGGKGWATLYAHFSKILVHEGQVVKQGDLIGLMGRTGHATGNHLHFEVRSERGPVDPLDYLPNGALVAKLIKDRKKHDD